ncbi:Biopolymer transport protein ExbD/TolR [Chthoniobacter flavus Ellin428]|jgi:biopolymer transport protein ExbD|uniref:Biopolymer transport protein ExbD/TolR n=1 Tax=Chthoniobacter flavus Ellin428 TaxID=497964 RepID=B4CVP3_9BACT|nr:biopolymer transporter ExbD [Chthoniobacter flavus]EDY21485.1 Biopolymer transport protein ExbD/TolR [Chthoniobacter flavus Ellin428]TCO95437.1 biopolymer transport protein ExbD [Chthoniobacter flavus]
MKLTRSLKFNPALFGVIPLINVIFLVVLFFVLSSRFVLQPGLAVTLPASSFTLGPRVDAQIVSITAAPVPVIYHRDQRVSLDELRQRLADTKVRERSLIIKADKNTPYDLVVKITDEALKLGFSVILATDSERK